MFTNKCKMVRNPHINANDQKLNANNGFSRRPPTNTNGLGGLYDSAADEEAEEPASVGFFLHFSMCLTTSLTHELHQGCVQGNRLAAAIAVAFAAPVDVSRARVGAAGTVAGAEEALALMPPSSASSDESEFSKICARSHAGTEDSFVHAFSTSGWWRMYSWR